MLPIRQTINALPSLNRTDKAVLIEVCQLAERSEQGWCTAKNDYLIEALASSLRTITRRLAVLEQRGVLVSEGEGKARRLKPTAALRNCYAAPTEDARQSAIANLANLASEPSQPSHFEPTNLATLGAEPSQSGQVEPSQPSHNASSNLATLGHEPSHFGSRVIGDQLDQIITSIPPTPEEWVEAQKKIADLEAENRQLKTKILELAPPVAATPHKPAPPRLTTYRDYDEAWPEQFAPLFDSAAYRAAWAQWGKYLDELGKPHRGHNHEKTDQAELGRMAAGSEQRAIDIITQTISAGWKRLIDHKPDDGGSSGKAKFGQAAPTPTRAGGSPSQAAAYRPR